MTESIADTDTSGQLVVESDVTQIEDARSKGQCWFDMVYNPVVAFGYPVPRRTEPEVMESLEIPLSLMIALSRADWLTVLDDTVILKGVISALAPVITTRQAVVWHFSMNEGRLFHEVGNAVAGHFHRELLILHRSHHHDL